MSGGGEDSPTYSGGDKKVGVVYDERMLEHNHPGNPFETPKRIEGILTRLKYQGLWHRCLQCSSVMIEDHLVEEVHSKEYATQIRESKLVNEGDNSFWKDTSVWINEGSSVAAACAAGSLVDVCRMVVKGELDSAFAIVRPPGHHAVSDKAMGFCLYNNVAIAAKFLLKEEEIKKILIVDWDYHHGNGTQEIFWNDERVLYFSVHGYGKDIYPETGSVEDIGEGNGKGYTVNVPFEVPNKGKKYGDADFLAVWDKLLLPIADKFKPDIVLISAGFDSARGDPLGKFSVTNVGYSILVERLLKYARGKLILALEGGYNVDVLSKCVEACITTLLTGNRVAGRPSSSRPSKPKTETLEIIKKVQKQVEQYWFLEPTQVDDSILMEKEFTASPVVTSTRGNNSTASSSRGERLTPLCKRKRRKVDSSLQEEERIGGKHKRGKKY